MKLEATKVYLILSDEELKIVQEALDATYWKAYDELQDEIKVDLFDKNSVVNNIVLYSKNPVKMFTYSSEMCYIVSLPNRTLYVIDLVYDGEIPKRILRANYREE